MRSTFRPSPSGLASPSQTTVGGHVPGTAGHIRRSTEPPADGEPVGADEMAEV
ncbi:hypothetical protein ACF1G5_23055 [Streptomyces coeruleorubidus]|uniref:hypothetical protein n=1 Tax=Streptomyces coeruleorubidus TaxID=116188 RepID=UPI0036FCBF4B